MKKLVLLTALIVSLGACTATGTKTTAPVAKVVKVDFQKRAVLLPINNTNDQPTADLLWSSLTVDQEGNKGLSGDEIKTTLAKLGYSIGDQLTQVTNGNKVEKIKSFQTKVGADNLVFLTVTNVDTKLVKGFKPKTVKSVEGEIAIYENGEKINTFKIEGTEEKSVSFSTVKLATEIGLALGKDKNMNAAIMAIEDIKDPKVRAEVADSVIALSGPLSTKLVTLMHEKGLMKDNPYKQAVNSAVKNAKQYL